MSRLLKTCILIVFNTFRGTGMYFKQSMSSKTIRALADYRLQTTEYSKKLCFLNPRSKVTFLRLVKVTSLSETHLLSGCQRQKSSKQANTEQKQLFIIYVRQSLRMYVWTIFSFTLQYDCFLSIDVFGEGLECWRSPTQKYIFGCSSWTPTLVDI